MTAPVIECLRCHRTSGPTDCCREVAATAAIADRRVEDALSRARGLAAQNRDLKRSNHELHVAWQREIDNRIHGEGLRAKIRELETEVTRLTTIGTIEATKAEWLEMRARAEKAEARIDKFDDLWAGGYKKFIDRLEKAEARAEKAEAERDKWKADFERKLDEFDRLAVANATVRDERDGLKARVAELMEQRDARTRLLREWLNTPYFDLETSWYDWAHPFSKRVLGVLKARESKGED
jgi:DNA repair exonuclease SbcCD ATPase subunit